MARWFGWVMGGLVTAIVALGGGTGAQAFPANLTLQNVVFSDGGTATGDIDINTYGYISSSTVVTTPGSPETFTGDNYLWPEGLTAPALFSSGTIILLTSDTNDGYVLNLIVAQGISGGMAGVDPIVGGYEECGAFGGCAGGVAEYTERAVNLADNPDLVVPEPVSMALLGSGLFGLALVRRRAVGAAVRR